MLPRRTAALLSGQALRSFRLYMLPTLPNDAPFRRKDCRKSIYAFGSRLALQCRGSCTKRSYRAALLPDPLGSLGFNFSQHGPTTRPSRTPQSHSPSACRVFFWSRCRPVRFTGTDTKCEAQKEPHGGRSASIMRPPPTLQVTGTSSYELVS